MTRFRKKQLEVEAVQWTGENREEVAEFANLSDARVGDSGTLYVGYEAVAQPGDWIVRLDTGTILRYKPDEFEATYEPADQPTQGVERTYTREQLLSEAEKLDRPNELGEDFTATTVRKVKAQGIREALEALDKGKGGDDA